MQQRTEAEKVFFEDIKEKKKAASGVHHKTGKNGYTGTIRFPTDFMTRKEKYNYRKAGKVMTTNLFDKILTIDEFETLETHEKRNRLQYWRNSFTNKEIMTNMKISNKKFYDIVADLDLPKAPRIEKKKRAQRKATINSVAVPSSKTNNELPIQQVIIEGMNLVYNGTYSAESLQKTLSKFIAILEGESDQFYIELKLMQKMKK